MDLYICMLKVITDKLITPMKFSMENIINLFAEKGSQMYGHEDSVGTRTAMCNSSL